MILETMLFFTKKNPEDFGGTIYWNKGFTVYFAGNYHIPYQPGTFEKDEFPFLKVEYVIFFLEGIPICCCFLVTRIFVTKSAQVEETNSILDQILGGLEYKK